MPQTDIVQTGNLVLRKTAREVPLREIKTAKIQSVIRAMKKALAPQEDGVAIAAPQIGVSLRIFLVSGKAFDRKNKDNRHDHAEGTIGEGAEVHDDLVFINPKLIKLSRKKRKMHEGCLSVRWRYGMVERREKATVTAYNEKAEKFVYGGSELVAQIFQHEIDHLDGILFTDKATELEDVPPETVKDPAWQKSRPRS